MVHDGLRAPPRTAPARRKPDRVLTGRLHADLRRHTTPCWSTRRSPAIRCNASATGSSSSGKTLTYVYATHGHGDHWFGTDLLLQRFPGSYRVRHRRHDREDARAGHDWARPDVGRRLPRPDPTESRCLPTRSRRRVRVGRPAPAGRRGRPHRHRRHHRAARAVDRAGRRRRRRLQRRAPVPAGERPTAE